MITVKAISRKSVLHKHYVKVDGGKAISASDAVKSFAMIPMQAELKKVRLCTDTDLTASNGYVCAVVNAQRSATILSQTAHSQISGEADWTANRVITLTPSANTQFTANSMLEFSFSGSVGGAGFAALLELDINEKMEK